MRELDFSQPDDKVTVVLTESQLHLLLRGMFYFESESKNNHNGWGVAEQQLLDLLTEFFDDGSGDDSEGG